MQYVLVHFKDAGAADLESESELFGVVQSPIEVISRKVVVDRVGERLLFSDLLRGGPRPLAAPRARQESLLHPVRNSELLVDRCVIDTDLELLVNAIEASLVLRLNSDSLLAHASGGIHTGILRHVQLFVVFKIVGSGVVVHISL